MKKLLFSLFAFTAVSLSVASAQEHGLESESEGTSEVVIEKREVIIIDEEETITYREEIPGTKGSARYKGKHSFSMGGIGLGYNGLVSGLGNLSTPEGAEFLSLRSKSINFNLQIATLHYRFAERLTFRTGFELEVNNFRFERNVSLAIDPTTGNTVADNSYTQRGIHLQKSKLVTAYINVPLILKFDIKKGKRNIYAMGGIVGGWRWITYTKVKANHPDFHGKKRIHNDYNIRNLHWGYTAGIGFKTYGFYATYYPNSIFKSGKGPNVKQVNIGVSLWY